LIVAGYDQPAPFRIRVDDPAVSATRNAGRRRPVPHELGLLPGVPTFTCAKSTAICRPTNECWQAFTNCCRLATKALDAKTASEQRQSQRRGEGE
jgi:hypothetical protein